MNDTIFAALKQGPRAHREMAERVAYRLGRDEGSGLEYTYRSLTDAELALALERRGWTWADVLRAES